MRLTAKLVSLKSELERLKYHLVDLSSGFFDLDITHSVFLHGLFLK
jgi:hypothetical protein